MIAATGGFVDSIGHEWIILMIEAANGLETVLGMHE